MSPIEQLSRLEAARDEALAKLSARAPFARFIGVEMERRGDELTARLRFDPKLIGSPLLPALHGGGIGAFLEITAILTLAWGQIWDEIEAGGERAEAIAAGALPPLPKTVDITINYLRAGRARDAFARASVTKHGRRVSNVRVEGWQEERSKPMATAHGHFLLRGDEAEAE
ncbi:MAG: PaaI family thioesterase [Pseudomonadota bacterium]